MSQEQHDDQVAPRPEDQQVSPGQAEPLEGEVVPGEAGQGALDVRYVQVGGMKASVAGTQGARALVADRVSGAALLADDRGQVWQRKGATWRVLTTEVSDLSYPLP